MGVAMSPADVEGQVLREVCGEREREGGREGERELTATNSRRVHV